MSEKYEKLEDGSYLHNCFLVRRNNDPSNILFYQDGDNGVTARLNGYAIIPLEEYFELKDELGENANNYPDEMLKNVEEADKQLHGTD